MNLYLLLPFSSCLVCAMLAVAILARDSRHRANRLGAALALLTSFWAACEVFWNTCEGPEAAMTLVKLSAIGWIPIGPIILHIFLELTAQPARRNRLLLTSMYLAAAALVLCDWLTPWVHPELIRTSWGWAYEVGPVFIVAVVFTAGTLTAGLFVGMREFRASTSPGIRKQAYWLIGGLLTPLFIASISDGILPTMGIQIPRLGATSVTILAATTWWSFHHFGYSMFAPGAFASEILATLRDGVALVQLDGRVLTANAGLARLIGVEPRVLEGQPIHRFIDAVRLESAVEVRESECTLCPSVAEPIPVSICTSPLRDKRENPIGLVVVVRDLREIASLRSRLITSGRLASVGQLAAGIAHEINNPVAFVRANLGALGELLQSLDGKLDTEAVAAIAPELDEGQELVAESLDGVDRVTAIVRDVRGFSHAGGGPREAVDLGPLLDSVLRVAAPQIRYRGIIERNYGETPCVRGAPQELGQVFLNLVMNASQAVEPADRIRISTRCEVGRAVVEIEDEGCGIPPDAIERIFDPFFTTKPVGEGTGLGLSISYQIVRNHGGSLSVESSPGKGTRFRVELPLSDADSYP